MKTARHSGGKAFLAGAILLPLFVLGVVAARMGAPGTAFDDPFSGDPASPFTGLLTRVGQQPGSWEVWELKIPSGEHAQTLPSPMDKKYYVGIEGNDAIGPVTVRQALRRMHADQGADAHALKAFGYICADPACSSERAHPGTWNGTFFTTQEQRAADDDIAALEASIGHKFLDASQVQLSRAGVRGVLFINETDDVELAIPVGGDGVVMDGVEGCDDGNRSGGDGCSPAFTVESGYTCSGQPSQCHRTDSCGNGNVDDGEECDPPGDYCDNQCHLRAGFDPFAPAAPSTSPLSPAAPQTSPSPSAEPGQPEEADPAAAGGSAGRFQVSEAVRLGNQDDFLAFATAPVITPDTAVIAFESDPGSPGDKRRPLGTVAVIDRRAGTTDHIAFPDGWLQPSDTSYMDNWKTQSVDVWVKATPVALSTDGNVLWVQATHIVRVNGGAVSDTNVWWRYDRREGSWNQTDVKELPYDVRAKSPEQTFSYENGLRGTLSCADNPYAGGDTTMETSDRLSVPMGRFIDYCAFFAQEDQQHKTAYDHPGLGYAVAWSNPAGVAVYPRYEAPHSDGKPRRVKLFLRTFTLQGDVPGYTAPSFERVSAVQRVGEVNDYFGDDEHYMVVTSDGNVVAYPADSYDKKYGPLVVFDRRSGQTDRVFTQNGDGIAGQPLNDWALTQDGQQVWTNNTGGSDWNAFDRSSRSWSQQPSPFSQDASNFVPVETSNFAFSNGFRVQYACVGGNGAVQAGGQNIVFERGCPALVTLGWNGKKVVVVYFMSFPDTERDSVPGKRGVFVREVSIKGLSGAPADSE